MDGRATILTSDRVTTPNCYFAPNDGLGNFEEQLWDLKDNLRKHTKPIVVGDDFNAKAVEWGSPLTDARGCQPSSITLALFCNIGDTPTYERRECSSTLDITAVSSELVREVAD